MVEKRHPSIADDHAPALERLVPRTHEHRSERPVETRGRSAAEPSAEWRNAMDRRTYCVYNATRECFLSLSVTAADTMFARLRGLIGKLKLKSNEGIWVVPSKAIHTLGVLFPIDLIYLDKDLRVIHVVEHFPCFRIAPLRAQAESVLELPTHTIYSSQTQPGDQLLICVPEEMGLLFQRNLEVRYAEGSTPSFSG